MEDNSTINLMEDNTDEEVVTFANRFIFEQIKNKNIELFLGKVINCACNQQLKRQLLCFQLRCELNENIFISILTKDFNLYNHPTRLSDFYCYGKIDFPYVPNDNPKSKEISIKLEDINGGNLEENLMDNITDAGNLIFLHPDNFI